MSNIFQLKKQNKNHIYNIPLSCFCISMGQHTSFFLRSISQYLLMILNVLLGLTKAKETGIGLLVPFIFVSFFLSLSIFLTHFLSFLQTHKGNNKFSVTWKLD